MFNPLASDCKVQACICKVGPCSQSDVSFLYFRIPWRPRKHNISTHLKNKKGGTGAPNIQHSASPEKITRMVLHRTPLTVIVRTMVLVGGRHSKPLPESIASPQVLRTAPSTCPHPPSPGHCRNLSPICAFAALVVQSAAWPKSAHVLQASQGKQRQFLRKRIASCSSLRTVTAAQA